MQKNCGLYREQFEHDNCGIGAVVNIRGIKSHEAVENALRIVEHLEHRAGKDAEGKTGDGVGILLQISHKFFSRVCAEEQIPIGGEREYGVAMVFFPQDELKKNQAKKMFEIIVEKEGMKLLGWRAVPVAVQVLGQKARDWYPLIWILTAGCILPAGSLNRAVKIRTLRPCPAARSSTRECFSWISFVSSSRICRRRIMSPRSRLYTPDSVQTPTRAGRGLIRTA